MPEGDTIFRAARTLQTALAGKVVRAWRSPLPAFTGAGLEGKRIDKVEPRGKNLLVHLDDGRSVLTHMRMTGSWHVYRPGERWQRAARRARLVLETDDFVAVCFDAPVVELLAPGRVARHESLVRLGPDVLAEEFDAAEARRRLRARDDSPIGEALLVQRALAGIGNIYKSESLFLCRLDPWRRIADLDDAALDHLVSTARDLMRNNLGPFARSTRPAGPRGAGTWVYGRRGEACLVCGARIAMRRQGQGLRSTYYCPECQRAR
jgi:endonuclease-8